MTRTSRFARLSELEVVVLDTETTGLDVSRDRLVQIGAVRVRDNTVRRDETFLRLVNPGIPIPPGATDIHGISDEDVKDAPSFEAVHADLQSFLGDAVIVGQSIGFDLAILLRETRRIGTDWRPPHFLDTKLLAAALTEDQKEQGLDTLAANLGVTIEGRHTALEDAFATAEVFLKLFPRLATVGIQTLGEAEAHSRAQTRILERQAREGWYDDTYVRPQETWVAGRDRDALAVLDPFLYRHQLCHVMRTPPLFVPHDMTAAEAARSMAAQGREVVFIGDEANGQAWGIVTERDLLKTLAERGAEAADARLESIMSAPIVSLPADAFLYRALGRMQRLGIRHLAATDPSGRIVGSVSTKALLQERASQAILLGDEVSTAETPRELARARSQLPKVVKELLSDGVDAIEIARVVTVELRELMGRGTVLAEKRMLAEGAGRPPVPYDLLVLGSGGREESMLAAEQNTALLYANDDPDGTIDAWFQAFADHLADILHVCGLDFCPNDVMARNTAWRGSFETWQGRVRAWTGDPEQALREQAALYFDGSLVIGDADLEADARDVALREASGNVALATALARPALSPEDPPSGEGRVDLKRYGLFPLTSAARALALFHGVDARSTAARLAGVSSADALSSGLRDDLDEVQARLMGWVLDQQIEDLDCGRAPSKAVDVARLSDVDQRELGKSLSLIAELPHIVRDGLKR